MNKRYKDLFQKLIYRGEKIPFSFGTLAVVAFCVLLIIISTFVRIEILHPWLIKNPNGDFEVLIKRPHSYREWMKTKLKEKENK